MASTLLAAVVRGDVLGWRCRILPSDDARKSPKVIDFRHFGPIGARWAGSWNCRHAGLRPARDRISLAPREISIVPVLEIRMAPRETEFPWRSAS